jgi:hypothetical protein
MAAVLALTVGLSVARSSPVGSETAALQLAAFTGGDLSETTLKRVVARLDPAAVALAQRHDPALFEPDVPRFVLDPAGLLEVPELEGEAARRVNAAIPFAHDQIEPAAPFVLNARSPAERERAVRCLTNAVYYEAALEPLDGQRAVAQVVVNRLRDPNFPKSVCGVVYEGWERLTGCQFSFTCDGALARGPIPALWERSRKVAEDALNGYVMAAVGAATHYHADYVAPYWAPALVKITQIGQHIFYRWPGAAGLPQALTAAYAGGELRLSEAVLTGRAARPTAAPAVLKDEPAESLPGVKTVEVTEPGGQTRTRVVASFAPAEYGRRQATPEEIAHINALLEARFPTRPAEAAPAPTAPAAETAG